MPREDTSNLAKGAAKGAVRTHVDRMPTLFRRIALTSRLIERSKALDARAHTSIIEVPAPTPLAIFGVLAAMVEEEEEEEEQKPKPSIPTASPSAIDLVLSSSSASTELEGMSSNVLGAAAAAAAAVRSVPELKLGPLRTSSSADVRQPRWSCAPVKSLQLGALQEMSAASVADGQRSQRSASVAVPSPPVPPRPLMELGALTINLADIKWVRALGAGDYGEVWLCYHAGARREMAAKRLKAGLFDEEARRAFLQEINLLSSLRHTNLVKVFGACETEPDGLCLFVELCTGSWRDRLEQQERSISAPLLVNVLRSVAAGMSYLHAHQVVHRDLKAANVLLRAKPELDEAFAVVSDMGLARIVDREGQMTVRGTVWIMAPEMLRHKRYDAAVDVFAFGLLVIESVTRLDAEDIPRTGKFLVDWAELREHAAIAQSTGERLACNEELLRLAADCCVDEPSARPSFATVAKALEALAARLPAPPASASAAPQQAVLGDPGSQELVSELQPEGQTILTQLLRMLDDVKDLASGCFTTAARDDALADRPSDERGPTFVEEESSSVVSPRKALMF